MPLAAVQGRAAGLRWCLGRPQRPLAQAPPAESCLPPPGRPSAGVSRSKPYSRSPSLGPAKPKRQSSAPDTAQQKKLRVVSSRGSRESAGKPDAPELDARIFALLVPAMLAVFLDPAMAVVDAGVQQTSACCSCAVAGRCTPAAARLCCSQPCSPTQPCVCSYRWQPGHAPAWSSRPEQPCILLLYCVVFLFVGCDYPPGGRSTGREPW